MSEPIRLLPDVLTIEEVSRHVTGISRIAPTPTSFTADFAQVDEALRQAAPDIPRTALDQLLVEAVHRALAHLPRTLLMRPGLWHHLTMERYSDFVWQRWWSGVRPATTSEMLARPAKIKRF